jgi:hypothetical protein
MNTMHVSHTNKCGSVQSVVITSGTLSPIDLYPRLLDFNPVSVASLQMTLTRECLCPLVLTRGADQMPVSTRFESRTDDSVLRYARMVHMHEVHAYRVCAAECSFCFELAEEPPPGTYHPLLRSEICCSSKHRWNAQGGSCTSPLDLGSTTPVQWGRAPLSVALACFPAAYS